LFGLCRKEFQFVTDAILIAIKRWPSATERRRISVGVCQRGAHIQEIVDVHFQTPETARAGGPAQQQAALPALISEHIDHAVA